MDDDSSTGFDLGVSSGSGLRFKGVPSGRVILTPLALLGFLKITGLIGGVGEIIGVYGRRNPEGGPLISAAAKVRASLKLLELWGKNV